MTKLVLREVDAHLVLFEDDASTTTFRDFFFHGGKFIGKKTSQALKGIVGEEEESLWDAGGAEATACGKEIPDATAVFVDVGREGAVFLFLAFDADELGNSLGVALDFTFNDDFGATAFLFIEADPDAFYFDVVCKEPFLSGFQFVGEPSVELALGNGDGVGAVLGSALNDAGNAGWILRAIVLQAPLDVGEVLRLEAKENPIAKRPDERKSEKDEIALHDQTVKRLREGEPTMKLTNFLKRQRDQLVLRVVLGGGFTRDRV